MKGAERAFVIWALAYLAVYLVIAVSVACAVHPDSSSIRYLIPFHLLGFAQNVAALILTIKDLFQREFPNPNDKLKWLLLILLTGGVGNAVGHDHRNRRTLIIKSITVRQAELVAWHCSLLR